MKLPPLALLVGGYGKRLHPYTNKIPKCLINIYNKTFLEIIIDSLIQQGIKKIILCVYYKENLIKKFLKNYKNNKIKIIFSSDGSRKIGNGGAIKKALPLLGKHFFVMYGDTFLNIDFKKVYKKYKSYKNYILLTVYKNKNKFDYSNCSVAKNNLVFYRKIKNKKLNYIDYGLSVFDSKFFKNYSNKKFELSELLYKYSLTKKIKGYIATKRFYHINDVKSLNETKKFLLKKL
jgi:NDP-sugar pyrophosphorylase family protein